MFKRKNIDATKGPIIPLIIAYTVPLILSTLVQTLFNAVDVVVLGNMASATAVASVGATSSIYHLLINGFVGISAGANLLATKKLSKEYPDKKFVVIIPDCGDRYLSVW